MTLKQSRRYTHRGKSVKRSEIGKVQELLKKEMERLQADACTFYVRDPYFPDDFRLLACPGVRFPETMHGFLSHKTSKKVVAAADKFSWSSDAVNDPSRQDPSLIIPESISAEKRYLFGDFVTREGIVSSGRFPHMDASKRVDAVLFVNYRKEKTPSKVLIKEVMALLDKLVAHLAGASAELQQRDAHIIRRMLRIVRAAQDLPDIEADEPKVTEYFRRILNASIACAGLDGLPHLGTIHLFDENDRSLALGKRYVGDSKRIAEVEKLSVDKGEGIISWVAIRRRAIVIPDLASSDFDDIRVDLINAGSELAVPMMAGDKLLGVLNLETSKKGGLEERHVRAISYAANCAATAVMLYREAVANRRQAVERESLEDILKSVSDWLFPINCGDLNLPAQAPIHGYVIRKPMPPSSLGGDFYAAESIDDDNAVILLGDASGKGTPGALNLLPFMTAFAVAYNDSKSPSYIMERVVAAKNIGVTATAMCCVVRRIDGRVWLTISSAGHPKAIVLRPSSHESVPKGLGHGKMIHPHIKCVVAEEFFKLYIGDVIIIYTDGISEAGKGSRRGALHDTGILNVASKLGSSDPETIAKAIMAEAQEYENPLQDDATVLVLRVK